MRELCSHGLLKITFCFSSHDFDKCHFCHKIIFFLVHYFEERKKAIPIYNTLFLCHSHYEIRHISRYWLQICEETRNHFLGLANILDIQHPWEPLRNQKFSDQPNTANDSGIESQENPKSKYRIKQLKRARTGGYQSID